MCIRDRYETVFILTPVLSEDQTKEAVKKVKDLIKKGRGKVHHEESWGMRKLAYPIQKKSTGFYHLFEFESEAPFVDKLETEYRRDERILRFMTVKMDKHHQAFADRRRNKQSAASNGEAPAAERPARRSKEESANQPNS